MHLPDINFWLALTFRSHAHHPSARHWMDSVALHSCLFCRVSQMGYLRVSTNRKAFPADALHMTGAWHTYDELLADNRIGFAEEPAGFEQEWRKLTQFETYSTNVWTDAYLAAFALATDLEVVTFDRGFSRFENLRVTILS